MFSSYGTFCKIATRNICHDLYIYGSRTHVLYDICHYAIGIVRASYLSFIFELQVALYSATYYVAINEKSTLKMIDASNSVRM